MIDVIVPVYRGLGETRRCLESVLASRCAEPHEVVVIDDASPEPGLSAWLRELAAAGRISLRSHAENRGFIASVNEGMALHRDRDVVLLNSDTEVPSGWLDRLADCARREPQAATVTPFSNNATICSYPKFAAPNALPEATTLQELDDIFRKENAGLAVEIPTAVGFCMYIRRAALEEVGAFDEDAYGRGYGEEVDFCMRAARAGLRNLLCGDLFVYHEGEVSFGPGAPAIRERAQAIVDERYPEFRPTLSGFIEREPLRPLRRAVDMARLRASSRPRLLLVSHAWGGGVEKHVNDLAKLLAPRCEVLLLRPDTRDAITVRWLRRGEEMQAWFEPAAGWTDCLTLLRSLGVARIHYHHVHDLPRAVLDLPQALEVPFDVTIHDHWPICPAYHMADASGRHCALREGRCQECLASGPAQWGLGIEEWRAVADGFLRGASRVIAPSSDLARALDRYFPGLPTLVWPHPELRAPAQAKFKVALLGGMSAIKGSRELQACVDDAAARELPLHFHVVGHVDRPMRTWPDAPLTIGGSYPDERLGELLELERPDAFLFLAQVPETYSYTLTVAMQSGLPIVATRLGAYVERLRDYRPHALVAPGAPAASVNDELLSHLRSMRRSPDALAPAPA